MLGAGLGRWRSAGIEYLAFGIDTVLLLGWGVLAWSARGRGGNHGCHPGAGILTVLARNRTR